MRLEQCQLHKQDFLGRTSCPVLCGIDKQQLQYIEVLVHVCFHVQKT